MRDHSHESQIIIFIAAGMMMGAVVLSGLDGGPAMFASASSLPVYFKTGHFHTNPFGSQMAANDPAPPLPVEIPGAAVVPNAASCPAANPNTALTPLPRPPGPTGNAALGTRAQNGSTLGTGTGCPPAVADTSPVSQSAGLNSTPASGVATAPTGSANPLPPQ